MRTVYEGSMAVGGAANAEAAVIQHERVGVCDHPATQIHAPGWNELGLVGSYCERRRVPLTRSGSSAMLLR